MFGQMLYTQWKWGGWGIVLITVAAFGIPIAVVQRAGLINPETWDVVQMLEYVQTSGGLFPTLALLGGLIMAAASWSADHRGDHVYALTLPIPRWYYALLRFGAGAVLLLPAVAALWLGGLIATSLANIPEGLRTFPSAIAFRFGLALLLCYAFAFAIASGTKQTLRIIIGIVLGVAVVQAFLGLLSVNLNLMDLTFGRLFEWPGPFELLFGRWMLISA
jgi:hypothetical protein